MRKFTSEALYICHLAIISKDLGFISFSKNKFASQSSFGKYILWNLKYSIFFFHLFLSSTYIRLIKHKDNFSSPVSSGQNNCYRYPVILNSSFFKGPIGVQKIIY